MAAYMLHIPPTTRLLTAHKKQQEPQKRAYLWENRGLGKKRPGEWLKSRKGSVRPKERQDYMQKNKRGDYRKNVIKLTALSFQTGGGDIRITSLPSAGRQRRRWRKWRSSRRSIMHSSVLFWQQQKQAWFFLV